MRSSGQAEPSNRSSASHEPLSAHANHRLVRTWPAAYNDYPFARPTKQRHPEAAISQANRQPPARSTGRRRASDTLTEKSIRREDPAMKITNEILEAYLNCKTKGHLKLVGETGTKSDYEAMTEAASRASRELSLARLVARYGEGDAYRGTASPPRC